MQMRVFLMSLLSCPSVLMGQGLTFTLNNGDVSSHLVTQVRSVTFMPDGMRAALWDGSTVSGIRRFTGNDMNTSVTEPSVDAFSMRVFPDPSGSTVGISFELDRAARVNLVVFDVSGRQVGLVNDGWLPPGRHQLQWDAASAGDRVADGLYAIRLTDGRNVRSLKFVLHH
jgi:hypothetical protein